MFPCLDFLVTNICLCRSLTEVLESLGTRLRRREAFVFEGKCRKVVIERRPDVVIQLQNQLETSVIVCPSVRLGLTMVKFSYSLMRHR